MYPHDYLERWHYRRLPHFEGGEMLQFVSFRLFDSIPAKTIENWKIEWLTLAEHKARRELCRRIEKYIDLGRGRAYLKNEKVALTVENTLFFWSGKKYKLIAWVIMPNHVHLLMRPRPGYSLSEIMHSIKSYSAKKANQVLKRKGIFWQHESFDTYIRDYRHFCRVVSYIENNPVKAKLCKNAWDWRFSSAYYRKLGG